MFAQYIHLAICMYSLTDSCGGIRSTSIPNTISDGFRGAKGATVPPTT